MRLIPKPDLIEHLPRLRRYARALTGDVARADDLVQDTLERALARLDLWQPGSDLRAWLFTLMHNLFVNQLRTRRPQDTALDEALEIPVSGGQMEALAARDMHAALVRLPDEQREVILLVGLEQFSYAEAAQVLGVPVGTIMSRLARARERMRHMLAGAPAVQLKVVKCRILCARTICMPMWMARCPRPGAWTPRPGWLRIRRTPRGYRHGPARTRRCMPRSMACSTIPCRSI